MNIYAYRNDQKFRVRLNHGQSVPVGDGSHAHRENSPHVSMHFSVSLFGGQIVSGKRSQTTFMIALEANAFAEVTQEMMNADPQAAIRAFGKAMQYVQIPMPSEK